VSESPQVRPQAADESACKPGSGAARSTTCNDSPDTPSDLRIRLSAVAVVLRRLTTSHGLLTARRRPPVSRRRLAELLAPYLISQHASAAGPELGLHSETVGIDRHLGNGNGFQFQMTRDEFIALHAEMGRMIDASA
jgi:hypothetical protein